MDQSPHNSGCQIDNHRQKGTGERPGGCNTGATTVRSVHDPTAPTTPPVALNGWLGRKNWPGVWQSPLINRQIAPVSDSDNAFPNRGIA